MQSSIEGLPIVRFQELIEQESIERLKVLIAEKKSPFRFHLNTAGGDLLAAIQLCEFLLTDIPSSVLRQSEVYSDVQIESAGVLPFFLFEKRIITKDVFFKFHKPRLLNGIISLEATAIILAMIKKYAPGYNEWFEEVLEEEAVVPAALLVEKRLAMFAAD